MKFFKYYFLEGDIPQSSIPFTKFSDSDFKVFKLELLETLNDIDESFKESFNEYLWDNIDQKIKEHNIFSSTAHQMFNNDLKTLDDVDDSEINIKFPEDLTEKLIEFISNSKGKTFGKMETISSNKDDLTLTLSTTAKFSNLVQNITIVFEPTFWQDDRPVSSTDYITDTNWDDDVPEEIQKEYYEYLLQSLIGSETLEKISIITPMGKVSKSEQLDNPKLLGFSVNDGIRTRFYPNTDLDGNIKIAGGKKSFQTTNRPETDLDTNLRNIYSVLFQELPSVDDINKMKSFQGVLELMKELDTETVDNILTRFSSFVWGDEAKIYKGEKDETGINKEDLEIKMAVYKEFIKYHPNVEYEDAYLDGRIRNFYQDN